MTDMECKSDQENNRSDMACNMMDTKCNGTNKEYKYDVTNKKEYKCETCGKSFSKSKGLAGHRLTHSGECPHRCIVCDKGFYARSNLTAHLRIHTGQKPYECDFCLKSFTQNGQLKQHRRIHSGELPYRCGACDRAFRNNSALVTHLRTHTGEKPYRCETCSRSFTTSTSLKTHRVTHSGVMLFDCPVCKRQFNRRNNLNVHIKRHNKDRRFSCPLCHNGFVMRAHLVIHLKRSHKIDIRDKDDTSLDSLLSNLTSLDSDKHRQAESLQTSDNKESVSPIKTDLVSQGKSLNLNNGTETKSISVKGIKEEKLGTESLVGIDTVPAFISNNQTEVISKDSVTEEIISSNQTHFIKAFEADHDSLRIKPEINVTGMAANIRAEKEDPSKEMIPCIKMEPFDHE